MELYTYKICLHLNVSKLKRRSLHLQSWISSRRHAAPLAIICDKVCISKYVCIYEVETLRGKRLKIVWIEISLRLEKVVNLRIVHVGMYSNLNAFNVYKMFGAGRHVTLEDFYFWNLSWISQIDLRNCTMWKLFKFKFL